MDIQNDTEKHQQMDIPRVEHSVYVQGVSDTVGAIMLAIIAFFLVLALRREQKENRALVRDLVRVLEKRQK